MANKVFQVAEVNLYIKNLFREDFLLNHLQIEGEVSNAKRHGSGHVYFTLKDEAAAISCVLFAGYASGVEVIPENGKKIIVTGSIGLYEKTGAYQVYVRQIKAGGQGDLFQKLEELKGKLNKEGIFQKPKGLIPPSPEKIGIVTSPSGAALQDILQIATRRNSAIQLILYPSLVQGARAAGNIARGISYFNNQKDQVDLIIIGRGGGSIEDLWPFNEEVLVRAIYHSRIPIISAVGHETDVTLSDLVADLRAPTPSAAAELAIPAKKNQKQILGEVGLRLNKEFELYLSRQRNRLEMSSQHLDQYHPRKKLNDLGIQLVERDMELAREFKHYLKGLRWQLDLKSQELLGLNPQQHLRSGYAYLQTVQGKTIGSVQDVLVGQRIEAILQDGKLSLKVEEGNHGTQESRPRHGRNASRSKSNN